MAIVVCNNVNVKLTAGGPGKALAVGALQGWRWFSLGSGVYASVGCDVTTDPADAE